MDSLPYWEKEVSGFTTLSEPIPIPRSIPILYLEINLRFDKSEIYGRHYVKIVIYPEKTLRIYYNYWWRNVTDGATITEWAMNIRERFCNALAIEHKYSDSLPID